MSIKQMSGGAGPFIALLCGAVGIGFAPILVRLSEVGPSATACYRLLLALPFFWVWMQTESSENVKRPTGLALVISGAFFAADLAVWHWSIQLTSVANATLLANFAPIFVVLGSWLIWGQRCSRSFFGAVILVLLGACLLVSASLKLDAQYLWGDALGLLTAVFYAGYMLSVARLRVQFSTVVVSLWTSLVGGGLLLLIALMTGDQIFPTTLQGWLVLVALAVISQVLGQSLIIYALAHLPTAFSSLSLLLQPVVAALLAWALFKEALGLWQGVGGMIVLLGIVLARRTESPA
ncbi:putative cystine transporter YijE [Acaryochloris thomasi RCC1774]|uniref:Putative cystine transporter YijE n=1 Tax=Acaryochloris thomasi RCC1774 TaxID=1764569 RepID=A0A2W1JY77_9CYAN|nr:DMT family transporter [Acaryochloris thomasi]PZD73531.1 putative cystine transporter YijE [Acaryochloris thomasi RCC1774]